GEVALNIANLLFEKNAVDLVVVDSVAALAPLAELNGDVGDSYVICLCRVSLSLEDKQ
ncbi:MAG: hypothetical protein Q8830_02935, partial [Candidatus Phytoplasma australasiaticum]|nr:hypothetical protein [Candidatus Phytoplasma australasiaticum]